MDEYRGRHNGEAFEVGAHCDLLFPHLHASLSRGSRVSVMPSPPVRVTSMVAGEYAGRAGTWITIVNPASACRLCLAACCEPANDTRRSSSDACRFQIAAKLIVPGTSLSLAWRTRKQGSSLSPGWAVSAIRVGSVRPSKPGRCAVSTAVPGVLTVSMVMARVPSGPRVADEAQGTEAPRSASATAPGLLFSPAANARHSSRKSK
jgi:hypothetical protein